MSNSIKQYVSAALLAVVVALGWAERPVLTQTAQMLYATFSGAPKALTATTAGYLNVVVGGGSITGIDSICLDATRKDACLNETANALLVKIQEPVPAQPTVALGGAGAGSVTNGTHVCSISFVTTGGETTASTASASVNVTDNTTNGKVTVTFATGISGIVTGRNVYCSKANTATPLFLVATSPTVANNSTTTYTLNIADASFTATGVPSANTAFNARVTVSATTVTSVLPITLTGVLTENNLALGTTSTDGMVLQNTTVATGGTPVQISPRTKWCGTGYNSSGGTSSETDCWIAETLPATVAGTTTSLWRLGRSIAGAAYTYPFSFGSDGTLSITGGNLNLLNTTITLSDSNYILWNSTGAVTTLSNGVFVFTNRATTAGVALDVTTDGTAKVRGKAGTAGTGNLDIGAKVTAYNNVNTAGWGADIVQGQATTGTVTNSGTASIAAYTVGAADGIFRVSCDVSITTSSTHSFSCDVVYTDAANVSRTMVLPVNQLAGTFITTGLITNVTGTGPYESAVMQIRAKASTSITIRTSAGGTFTGVVYTASGSITQIG